MNRRAPRHTFAIMAILLFLATLSGVGWSQTEPTVIPVRPATGPFSVGYSNDGYEGFHHTALQFAMKFLEERRAPLIYANKELVEKYMQFGVLYADEPWSGVPGAPHRDMIGDKGLPWFSFKINDQNYAFEKTYAFCGTEHFNLHVIETHLNAKLNSGLFSYTLLGDDITHPITERKVNPYIGARWDIRIQAHLTGVHKEVKNINRPIGPLALENMYHFTNYVPIKVIVIDESGFCSIKTSDIEFAGTNITKTPIVEMTISAQEYGATLYQLARKFLPSSCDPGPGIRELPYKQTPGNIFWPVSLPKEIGPITYLIEGISSIAIPSTYIGGQPYMCFRSTPPPSNIPFDSCHPPEGKPSWPLWVAAEAKDDVSMEDILKDPFPDRNIETALVYLGWAIHVMQDLSVPAHRSNVHGDEVHTQFENNAAWNWKYILDKEQLNQELMNDPDIQKLLSVPSENLSVGPGKISIPGRRKICSELGWSMEQPVDNLGVKFAQSGFEKTASLYSPLKNGEEEYKKSIIRSIRDTILMLGCLSDEVVIGKCKEAKRERPPFVPDFFRQEKVQEKVRQFCARNPNSPICKVGFDIPGGKPGPSKIPLGSIPGQGKPGPSKIPPGSIPSQGNPDPLPFGSPR